MAGHKIVGGGSSTSAQIAFPFPGSLNGLLRTIAGKAILSTEPVDLIPMPGIETPPS